MGDNGGEQQLKNITEVQDSDVLCGRGGAALRHAGNQTYRKLVSLNKGLYITCLKTEKLKISRSIVAAIREKKGRFLEKDAASGTWYDIGDKKAVEKTSQALREGQPKLRQQIVEMGGGAAGAASLIESQFGAQAAAAVGAAGLYSQGQMSGGAMMNRQQMNAGNASMRQQMLSQQEYAVMQQQQMRQQQMRQQQMNGGLGYDDIQNDLMNRLSLHEDNGGMGQQGNMGQRMPVRQMMSNGMGMTVSDSQIPHMNEYGGYGTGQMRGQLSVDDGSGGIPMDNSFRAAMHGMASPPSSVGGGSMHSTLHTLDFSSMHSMDHINGISTHSMGLSSNHTMGPPSAHLPTMSSISRQQQIDERYPQNLGLNTQVMSQSFRRQGQDNQPRPPPQPSRPEQHPGQMNSGQNSSQQHQQRLQDMQQQAKLLAVQGARFYNGIKEHEDDLEPVPAFPDGSGSGGGAGGGGGGGGGGYMDQRQQQSQPSRAQYSDSNYPQERHNSGTTGGPGGYNDDQGQSVPRARGYDDQAQQVMPERQRVRDRSQEGDQRLMGPPDRNISSSNDGTPKNASLFSLNQSMASITSTSTNPSVLRPEARQKMDRRNMFAKMKFTRPPSVRDTKMGLNGQSTHSTGDGMPDIHMVESQHSLHSQMSTMTDGVMVSSSKGSWVETAKVVDHSSKADYNSMDVLAGGSKHSIMSGLSRISDHSLNDGGSIFSSLSKQIGNVSTRSIAMSEISIIDVAEQEDEDEGSSNHESNEKQEG